MKKIYLFVFNPAVKGDDAVLGFLDSRQEIADWHAFPRGVFLVTDLSSEPLRDLIREGTGLEWFILTELRLDELGTSLSGWLPRASWEFLGRYAGDAWPKSRKQPA